MKQQPSKIAEGPQAWNNFDRLMGNLLSVPHSEIVRREEAYKKASAKNPNRPGPKPKRKRT